MMQYCGDAYELRYMYNGIEIIVTMENNTLLQVFYCFSWLFYHHHYTYNINVEC